MNNKLFWRYLPIYLSIFTMKLELKLWLWNQQRIMCGSEPWYWRWVFDTSLLPITKFITIVTFFNNNLCS